MTMCHPHVRMCDSIIYKIIIYYYSSKFPIYLAAMPEAKICSICTYVLSSESSYYVVVFGVVTVHVGGWMRTWGAWGLCLLSLFREFSANLSTRQGVILLLVDAVGSGFVPCVYNGFMVY